MLRSYEHATHLRTPPAVDVQQHRNAAINRHILPDKKLARIEACRQNWEAAVKNQVSFLETH